MKIVLIRRWLSRAVAALLLTATSLVVVAGDASAATTIRIPADYETLAEAVEAAEAGDTILVAPGRFTGSVKVFTPDLTVVSEAGAALTTLDLTPSPGRIVVYPDATGFKIDGFTIENGNGFNTIDSTAPDTIVRNNIFTNNHPSNGEVVEMRLGGTVRSNLFTGNSCETVAELDGLGGTAHFVNNLVIDNPSCGGVEVGDGPVEVVNNTFVGNDQAIQLDGGASSEIRNNIVSGNRSSVQLVSGPGYPAGMHTNLFWDSPPHDEQDDPAGWNGNIGANPKLSVNKPGLLGYGLKPSSPAIDAGVSGGLPATDFFGGIRKVDGDGDGAAKVDLGAIEYMSGIASLTGSAAYPSGHPAYAACVNLWLDDGGLVSTTEVDADGGYAFVAPAGMYEVEFTGCNPGSLVPVWYGGPNREGATVVPVAAGGAVSGINAAIQVDPSVLCAGIPVTILGTGAIDLIVGTDADDVIDVSSGKTEVHGGKGDDTICGGGAGDDLYGDQGRDTLVGGGGNDDLYGGTGGDFLRGGDGSDRLYGGNGSDEIKGNAGTDFFYNLIDDGDDQIDGGAGEDYLRFEGDSPIELDLAAGTLQGRGADIVVNVENAEGTAGDDIMRGDEGINRFLALGGDDLLEGRGGDDDLYGGDGHDTFNGGEGNDDLNGSDGDDSFVGEPGDDVYRGDEGVDELDLSMAPAGINISEFSRDTQMGQDGFSNIESIIGSAFDDRFNRPNSFRFFDAGPGADIITPGVTGAIVYGRGGADTIKIGRSSTAYGGAGDDILKAGDWPNAALFGGKGDDTITGGDEGDYLDGGPGDDTIKGKRGDDTLIGGSGDDYLHGGKASDLIIGGSGADVIYGDTGIDGIIPGPGPDTVDGAEGQDIVSYEDATKKVTIDLSAGTATGWGQDTLLNVRSAIGGQKADTIVGDDKANGFNGGLGVDTVNGGGGDDLIFGWKGGDFLFGESGDDYLDGQAGSDTLDGGPGTDNCVNGTSTVSCEENQPLGADATKRFGGGLAGGWLWQAPRNADSNPS